MNAAVYCDSAAAGNILPVGRRYVLALYALVVAVAISPLFWAPIPPLVDYPNHLARMWILLHHREIPDLARNYIVHWRLLPDLGMDLVVMALSPVMPVEQAGRVFVALTMLAPVGGTLTLHHVLYRRLEIWPICSALFVFNAALFWGFVSCLFATGICFFVFSGWIATRYWPIGPRLALFSALASLLLLLHLFAFGLYALAVTTYELGRRIDAGPLSRGSLLSWIATWVQLIPGAMLWYASLAHSGSTLTVYGDPQLKIYALLSPFVFGIQPTPFDALVTITVCSTFAVALMTRALKLAPEMRLPLAGMVLAAVLMPHRTSGSLGADIRLPIVLPFLIIASTRLEITRKKVIATVATAALVLSGLRVWSLSVSWSDYDRWFVEFRNASAVITSGARLAIVQAPVPEERRPLPGLPRFFGTVEQVSFIHMAALAVIDRAAFFPYLFTGWTTIDVAPIDRPVAQREGWPANPDQLAESATPVTLKYMISAGNVLGELPYWRNWPETFDYVLWMDFGTQRKSELKQLRLLKSGSFFKIYRVVRK